MNKLACSITDIPDEAYTSPVDGPHNVRDLINAGSECEAYELLTDAISHAPTDCGDMRKMLCDLIEQRENYPSEVSANFKSTSAAYMTGLVDWIIEVKREEL